eukprot:6077832-Prymnesium_polylepis.1
MSPAVLALVLASQSLVPVPVLRTKAARPKICGAASIIRTAAVAHRRSVDTLSMAFSKSAVSSALPTPRDNEHDNAKPKAASTSGATEPAPLPAA